jgi:hypothetical protein
MSDGTTFKANQKWLLDAHWQYPVGGLIAAPEPLVEFCPHCSRDWHTQALTEEVARMYDGHRFTPGYNPAQDNSPIVCVGSETQGPARPKTSHRSWTSSAEVVIWPDTTDFFAGFKSMLEKLNETFLKATTTWSMSTGSLMIHDDLDIAPYEPACSDLPDIAVEFGPQNWLPAAEPVQAVPMLRATVNRRWRDFTKADIPAPVPPGYDFSRYETGEPKYPNQNHRKGTK